MPEELDLSVGHLMRFAAPMLQNLLQGPDPRLELDCRIKLLTLQSMKGRGRVAVFCSLPDLVCKKDRQDWLVTGVRGAGKTAFAAMTAQLLSAHLELEVFGVGLPEFACDALGFSPLPLRHVGKQQDCILFVDEAGLQVPPKKASAALLEMLSTARHQDVSVIWTAQGLSQLDVRLLRYDLSLCFKRLDPVALRLDREELRDLLEDAAALQVQYEDHFTIRDAVVFDSGSYFLTASDLPVGWSEEVSRMWRRREVAPTPPDG